MRELSQAIIEAHEPTVQALLDLLSDLSDPERKPSLIEDYVLSPSLQDKSEAKKNRLKFGYFSQWDLIHLLLSHKEKAGLSFGVNGLVLLRVIDRLKKFGLVTESDFPGLDEFRIPESSMRYFHQLGLDRNIVFGIPYMVERTGRAVPAINVRSPGGAIECGSGIIIRPSPQVPQAILLTNRHVIEGKEILEARTEAGSLELMSPPILHKSADLAAFKINAGPDVPIVPIDDTPPVLTPIIALGYPRVPTASGQFLMAHRGEINGRISTLFGDTYLAISCVVSPGNSGGPIMTEAGFCAGIVTQSGIGEFGREGDATGVHRMTYHMAIPPEVVSEFVKSIG